MRSLFTIIILLCFPLTLISQIYWSNLQPQGNDLLSVSFPSNSIGYAVGLGGTIIKSNNGGKDWTVIFSENNNNFIGSSFPSVDTGFVSGLGIYRTTDAGKNWLKLNTPTEIYALDIHFVNSLTGFAIGFNGEILKTIDAGNTWSAQPNNNAIRLNKIFFTSIDTGFIVGNKGIILKTTNRGNNWDTIKIGTSLNLNSINFINDTIGFIVGGEHENKLLLKTVNQGKTWNIIKPKVKYNTFYNLDSNSYKFERIFFISDSIGFITGNNHLLLKTYDGGLNWYSKDPNKNYMNGVLCGITFFNKNRGIIVGGYGDILLTEDQGETWININYGDNGYFNDIAFINNTTGLVIGANGKVLKTTNSGASWNKIESPTKYTLNSLYILNKTKVIAVGEGGTILISLNAGNSWQEQNSFTKHNLLKINFLNENIGYVIGSAGTILRTKDGGLSWSSLNTGTNHTLRDIQFINENIGFAVGGDVSGSYSPGFGVFLKTKDGGLTWEITNNFPAIWSVYFFDENNGFINTGNLLKTEDGGKNWIKLTDIPKENPWDKLQDFKYINNNLIYGLTNYGIIKSIDEGKSWTYTPSINDFFHSQRAFDITTCGQIYIAGDVGTILKYETVSNDSCSLNKIKLSDNSFFIYPNPIENYFIIRSNSPGGQYKIEIFDMNGKIVLSQVSIIEYEKMIDIKNLENGTYILIISNEIKFESFKLIKE